MRHRVRLVVGEERHSTIDRSLRYLGFGASALEVVESDSQGAMRPAALAATLFSGVDGPTIVCAQAGNVNSGAFDPFAEICDIAHEHGAWVHIDGAFGLWAAASQQHRHLLDGYERADSWATDAHKWLNVPYDCGIALTAHPSDHAGAFAARAEYLVFSDGIRDPMDFTPEASRRARARSRCGPRSRASDALASPSSSSGAAHVHANSLTRCAGYRGSRYANDVVINQIVVRFPGLDGVLEAVSASGACVMTPTTWKGEPGVRISVSNWQTTERDIEISVDAIRATRLPPRVRERQRTRVRARA